MELTRNEVLQALARGFCTKANEHKTMDADLCNAMADEVMSLAHLAARERRKALKAHIIGIVGYMGFFALGVYVGANWTQIIGGIYG